MIFAQHNADTQRFFMERYGRIHGVPISDAPHGRFLAGDEDAYRDYLRASWRRHSPTDKAIDAQVRTYRSLVEDCLLNRIGQPVQVAHRLDGAELVVDGNHRAAIAEAYELACETIEIPRPEQMQKHTGQNPYQTLYGPSGEPVVIGRRTDLLRRFRAFHEACPVEQLGHGVLDLGCNLGSNLLLANAAGAVGCLGVERHRETVDSASRLAAFYGAEVEFQCADLEEWRVPPGIRFDIACCFSVWAPLQDRTALCEAASCAEWLWLEGHARTSKTTYHQLLDRYDWEIIGWGDDGELPGKQTRPWILGRRK